MKRGLMFILSIAFGLMLWGCSSQTQDPVSSISSVGTAGPQILHKTVGSPTNVLAVVNGLTVTISWDSVALADSYHVVITLNGNPYLSVKQATRQLVVPNLLFGSYSVTVAAVVGGLPEGTASNPVLFTLGSMTNVQAVVSGFTVTITWDPVALADSYHVVITLNGNSYLNVKQVQQQLVVPNLLFGSYSVTVAAIRGTLPEGTASAPVVFALTLGSPNNVHAVVNGSTATVTWDSVATADGYHVVITLNGSPYLNITQAARQLVVPNLPSGTYSVTVAAVVNNKGEGATSTPVGFTVSSVVMPSVTVTASPVPRCVRNGEWVTVTFSGVVTNSVGGASYELKDEYRRIHYTGTVAAGPYSVNLKLKDRRLGFDRDGRQYTFTITATNSAGTAKASVVVTVPQDRHFHDWDDDDDDDSWGWGH